MTRFLGLLVFALAMGCSGAAEEAREFEAEDVTATEAGIQTSTTTGTEGSEVTGSTTSTTAASAETVSTSTSTSSSSGGPGGGAGEASTETSSTSAGGAGGSGTSSSEATTGEATTAAGGTTSTDTSTTTDTETSTSSSTTGAPPGPDACNPPGSDNLVQACCGACEGAFDEGQLGCVECGSACSLGEFESDEAGTRSFVFEDGCSSQHLSVASERVELEMLCTKLWSPFPGWVLDTHSSDEVYSHGELEEFSDTGSSYRDCVVVGSTDSEVAIKADRSEGGASWLSLQRGDCAALSCD